MRNQDQVIGNIRALQACSFEAMESRTLLAAAPGWFDQFHGLADGQTAAPSHVVAPFGLGLQHHDDGAVNRHWQAPWAPPAVVITDDSVVIPDSHINFPTDQDHDHHIDGKSLRSVPEAPNFGDFGIYLRDMRSGRAFAEFIFKIPRNEQRDDGNTPRESSNSGSGQSVQSVGPAVLESPLNNATSNSPAASTVTTARAVSPAVAKAIFSTQQVAAAAPVAHGATSTPSVPSVASGMSSDLTGRTVLMYLSLAAKNIRPELVEAKAAAAATVLAQTVANVAEEGAQAAIASAVGGLTSARQAITISRLGSPFMLIADSIGNFIEESAQISTTTSTARHGPRRAWMVTAAVIAADIVLVSYCYLKRRKTSPELVGSSL